MCGSVSPLSSAVFSAVAAENKKYEPPVPDQTAESYQIARKVDETKAELKVQLLSDLLSSHGQEEAELIGQAVTGCHADNLLYCRSFPFAERWEKKQRFLAANITVIPGLQSVPD